MKRRNGEFVGGKLRRPTKRSKISDGLNQSPLIYLKFLFVWALVLLADFILEFRFEYLWPFWLLLRSVYDSFKYQGLAFSIFFVFIALTSDLICFLFIPVHWLFFAASTYVWVQYVWHTERGICLPTVSLWLLFVYIEASVRLRELKNLPFHLDLCRPFAAHCIGYPVVTLGFGFKSYVSYRMRLRKQKEVAKENEFYMEMIQKALPQPEVPPPPVPPVTIPSENQIQNGIHHMNQTNNHNNNHSTNKKTSINTNNEKAQVNGKLIMNSDYEPAKKFSNGTIDKHELQYMEHQIIKKIASLNDYDVDVNDEDVIVEHKISSPTNHFRNISSSSSISSSSNSSLNKTNTNSNSHSVSPSSQQNQQSNKWNHVNNISNSCSAPTTTGTGTTTTTNNQVTNTRGGKAKNNVPNNLAPIKDDHIARLESDIKRLKADLQASRQCEMDLRSQLNSITCDERNVKNELAQLRQDNDNLQQRLHNLVTARQQDKQTITKLEKNLDEEKKKLKNQIDTQLANERKAKKAEEAAARAVAIAAACRTECSEICKARRRDVENDLKQLQQELKLKDEQLKQSEKALRQYKNSHDDAEVLMSALSAMQEKNGHLEKSLSAETRLKLDLFSALDETKRQLEMTQIMVTQREKEIDELKSKIAEVMAVMPSASNYNANLSNDVNVNSLVNSLLPMFHGNSMNHGHGNLSNNYMQQQQQQQLQLQQQVDAADHNSKLSNSLSVSLDPNASIYTPKSISSPSDL